MAAALRSSVSRVLCITAGDQRLLHRALLAADISAPRSAPRISHRQLAPFTATVSQGPPHGTVSLDGADR